MTISKALFSFRGRLRRAAYFGYGLVALAMITLVFLVVALRPGTPGPNRFGAQP